MESPFSRRRRAHYAFRQEKKEKVRLVVDVFIE